MFCRSDCQCSPSSIEKYHLAFGAGEEQAGLLRILTNNIDRPDRRQPVHNFRPRCAAVVRPVYVRTHVVTPDCVDR